MVTDMSDSIVFTNENCIGCNKCTKVCSAMGACVYDVVDGRAHIRVDGSKCVACGSCFDVCEHNAREFRDDTERFFADLKEGKEISLLLAPAFKANYPDEYESTLGALKMLGVKRIISVSFGADITTWGYLNYIKKYDFLGGISQPCPAVVSYIERYLPDLIPKLFPVQSPLMCAAIYARKEMGITDRFAFISPCIAKKLEVDDPANFGLVQYNVTFEHLMKYVRENGLKGDNTRSEIEYGLGSFYPTPGGLAENVKWFLGDHVYIRQIEGEKHLYEWMHINEDRIKNNKTPFLFIDALNCEKGCICGTAVDPDRARTDDALYNLLDIREQSKKDEAGSAWSRNAACEERLANYNKQFSNLKLEDYLRTYTDRSSECRYDIPNDEQLEEIFVSMNKLTEEERNINCTCCGYDSCRQMATAIFNGFNHRDNCIYYEKSIVQSLEVENAIAQEATRAKSSFLANMSHEIRTPINAVLGMNEMVLRESEDQNIIAYSESIRSAGNTLLALVNNILDFSKIESGEMDINPTEYDLSSVINDLVNMIQTRADDKGLLMKLDFDPKIPKVLYGDELRIKQVIANLLTNAVKYTEEGTVTFGVGYEDAGDDTINLKVRVEDTGIGIKPEDLDRLYNQFDRIEESRNRSIEGTGLGMNITQKLLELMGSSLEVKSEYGKGSVFSFSLSQTVIRRDELGDYQSVYENMAGKRKSYRQKITAPDANVLMIDDNLMNLMVFKSLLKQTKIKVDTASSGDEGIKLACEKQYDIMFFDHMMPDKDGIETLHELKSIPDNPNISTPVVCLTANAVSGAREDYLKEGFDDYMTKPIDPEKLEDMLREYIPEEKIIGPKECTGRVAVMSFVKNAVALGIAKALESLGYDVVCLDKDSEDDINDVDAGICLVYIRPYSCDDAIKEWLKVLAENIDGSRTRLLVVCDNSAKNMCSPEMEAGVLWESAPVDINSLAVVIADNMPKREYSRAKKEINRVLLIDEDPARAKEYRAGLTDLVHVDVLTSAGMLERFLDIRSDEESVDMIISFADTGDIDTKGIEVVKLGAFATKEDVINLVTG